MLKIIDYLAKYRLFKQKNRLSTNSRYYRHPWPPCLYWICYWHWQCQSRYEQLEVKRQNQDLQETSDTLMKCSDILGTSNHDNYSNLAIIIKCDTVHSHCMPIFSAHQLFELVLMTSAFTIQHKCFFQLFVSNSFDFDKQIYPLLPFISHLTMCTLVKTK